MRVNTTDLFHVDLRHWTTLRARDGAHGPRERAFHTATVIGDYMVVYGGNVHIHYHEEKCYEDEIFFYHLGCHQWVPSAELAHGLPHDQGSQGSPGQGRYAHVAGVLRGSVLLVAGGFSGTPRGDLLAYKVPAFVFQVPAQNCPSTSCLGLARLLVDCESCLAFGGAAPGPPRSPGPFGWCVQNDTCMPVAEQSRCRVGQISGTYGWWGPRPVFITALPHCRTANFLPGLHLVTYQQPRNDSQPDKVSIVRSTTITLSPSGDTDVSLVYRGFIYPLVGPPPAPGPGPSVWARIQRLYVVARLGRHPNSPELEEVGRWWVQQERETRPLQRPRPERLFGAPERGNRYLVQVEGHLNASGSGQSSELTLVWDRTGVPGGSDPFCEWQVHSSKKGDFVCSRRGRQAGAVRTPQDCPSLCSQRRSCSECLASPSQCAWCQSTRRCFFFAAYLAKYPYGDCRGWDDRCLEGDFSGLRGYPNCSVALGEPGGLPPGRAAAWSYGQCPDVDECRLGMAACHPAAACHNTPQAFECRCRRGFAGDGTTHCNRTDGGSCYRECGGRSLLANLSSAVALGSRLAGGGPAPGGGLSYCVWVLSVTGGLEPCPPGEPCPPISLTLHPDLHTPCATSYAYAFDGVPSFLDSGVLQGDPTLLGAFCGRGRPEPLTLEARSGVLVLYYEANGSEPTGFNASVGVQSCRPPCSGGQECRGGRCVCRGGYGGPGCRQRLCPGDCGARAGHGVCNATLGLCACSEGYAGPDCSVPLGPGSVVWETLVDGHLAADTASRFLHRLGHSLVEGPEGTLWMFGGLSLPQGLLGNVYRYSIPERRWTQMLAGAEDGGPGPSPRYFHAAAPLPARRAMLVLGGLTAAGVASDAWVLDLTTLQWRQQQDPRLPAVAGHTLTPRRGTSLLLIGGYSPENGFNRELLRYRVETESWEVGRQAGTPPTGLYGHSAVYHEATDAVYVFGGQRFHVETVGASPELYSLHCPNLTWSLLAPSRGRKAPPQCKWCTNCPEGACIGSGGSCTSENDCRINQREIFAAANCSEVSCEASDCPKCTASGKCMWTRQFKRTGETRRILSVQPTYDWTCFSHSLLNVSPMPVESSPPLPCPTPCHNHSSCPLCLASKGADGGWQRCVWSVSLQQACGAEAEWAFLGCPPENECLNGHHDCNETQDCHDLPHGYRCACKSGYTLDNATGLCRPVCEQGCVNGTCVEPNRCRCHFGYVGHNCSVQCQCNGHSQCRGPAARDQCLQCFNNTKIPTWVSEGPSEEAAVCVNCQNNSVGERCDGCRPGFFLLDGACTKCQCNGHADTCNELDGTGCPCQNNTETGSCQGGSPADKKDCYKQQCAKCRDSFHGHPVGGQQCYRLMAVEQEYCLDPTSQSNCFHQPQLQHLGPGRTVLFGVQPKFTNVDIRITLDVTFGGVDLFVSTAYDTFAVDVDPATGRHVVRLQTPHASSAAANATRLREERAGGLVTYLTVREAAAALVVRGVRDRLVLTYPHALHPLKSSRFYLLLLGVGGPRGGPSQGLLFFRQDQAHIDLFVFFSVFFSCFFLFLALCVLLWKAKQGLDARHEQRRHLQEMSKMASRPFAKVTVCFERGAPPGPPSRRRPPLPAGAPLPPQPGAGPVTLEPTEDGVAAVATLLLQLPGGPRGPHRAALASALVTLRQGLQEYGGGPPARKGGLAHELTSMAL
ncbi:multiple epidermal growth factor-like domains protein 8 [Grus japonensis]|uniref:Multiple epidermal growth factor-like domains protein 8 n=1 Tax=Grus japonensis TaxID=30415 RepID=A0ABC9XSI7_GRUJA